MSRFAVFSCFKFEISKYDKARAASIKIQYLTRHFPCFGIYLLKFAAKNLLRFNQRGVFAAFLPCSLNPEDYPNILKQRCPVSSLLRFSSEFLRHMIEISNTCRRYSLTDCLIDWGDREKGNKGLQFANKVTSVSIRFGPLLSVGASLTLYDLENTATNYCLYFCQEAE